MKNNNSSQSSKQTLQDVLTDEEPTKEFLEEFQALEESEEISEIELTKLALASQADNIDNKIRPVEPDYKTNETNYFQHIISSCDCIGRNLLYIYFLKNMISHTP